MPLAPTKTVVSLYRDGVSAAEIGDILGCSKPTVLNRLREAGEPIRPIGQPPKQFPGSVLGRYEAGESMRSIAEEFGCSEWAVKRYLRQSGVQIARTGPRRRLDLNESFFHNIQTEEQAY